MQKHDVLPVSCRADLPRSKGRGNVRFFPTASRNTGRLKGNSQTFQFPVSDLFKMFIGIQTLVAVPLRPDQRIIFIGKPVILQKFQPAPELFVQTLRLFGIPEHVVIPPEQDLPSGQLRDKLQIFPALLQVPSPGMVPGDHHRIPVRYPLVPVFPNLLFMVLPDSAENIHRFIDGKGQVKVPDRVKAHGILLVSLLLVFPTSPALLFRNAQVRCNTQRLSSPRRIFYL